MYVRMYVCLGAKRERKVLRREMYDANYESVFCGMQTSVVQNGGENTKTSMEVRRT